MAYLPKKILLDVHRIASDVHWKITDIETVLNKNLCLDSWNIERCVKNLFNR